MTKDHRRENVADECKKGDGVLSAARVLLSTGHHADAVSRAYYAAFHYARALLFTLGEEARTHGGVERLLQRNFVATGRMDAMTGKLLARLQMYRYEADYSATFVFTEASAREEVDAAERFVGDAARLLREDGWID